jgi:two-component sensor histidine kinase
MATQRKRLIRIFSNPFFIAIILAIPCCVFLSHYFPRYVSKLTISSIAEKEDGILYFYDLDNDGYSEEIISFTNTRDNAAIKITDRKGSIIYTNEYHGNLPFSGTRLIIGDHDGNGIPEIFAFYVRSDSLFLKGVEFDKKKSILIPERFITYVGNREGDLDFSISDIGMQDMNADGNKELIFAVMAGFPIFPRNIYRFDISKDFLLISPHTGGYSTISDIYDIDNDGKKELFLHSYAPGNMKDTAYIGLSDSSAWLIVLTDQLKFKFPTYEFKGYTSGIHVAPFIRDNAGFIGVVCNNHAIPSRPAEICTFDASGNLLRKQIINDTNHLKALTVLSCESIRDCFAVLNKQGLLVEYDQNLKVLKKENLDFIRKSLSYKLIDIDLDGKEEYLFYGNGKDVIVTRNDFSSPVFLDLPPEYKFNNIGIKRNGDDFPEILLQSGRHYYLCNYSKNPFYYWQFSLFIGVFGVLSLIIFLIQYMQKIILRDKYRAEKKISELQLLILKDQMDPHFIFNAINSISSLVMMKKPEEAHQRIIGLSKLMRNVVESSGKISRPLNEEIEFVRHYLEFQQSRNTGLVEFSIDLSVDVNPDWQVPRMAIQIYVENAIKHGILPLRQGGMIRIKVSSDQKNMLIEVEDNGIGRHAASAFGGNSTGKGLGILDQYFEILNKYHAEKITYTIFDLQAADLQAAGTRVVITIPVNMKYKIYEG